MTLFILSSGLSLLFMFSKTPLMLAMLIVLQTIVAALSIYTLMLTSWLSYILFMILVSAMMVIFVYVSSLASNDFIILSSSALIITLYLMPWLIFMAWAFLKSSICQTTSQMSMSDMDLGPMGSYKIYDTHTSDMTVFLMTYLLVTLIVVAKISVSRKGALRAP